MNTLNNLFGSKYNGGESFINSLEQDSKSYPPHTLPFPEENSNENFKAKQKKITEFNFLQKEKAFNKYENSMKKTYTNLKNNKKFNSENENLYEKSQLEENSFTEEEQENPPKAQNKESSENENENENENTEEYETTSPEHDAAHDALHGGGLNYIKKSLKKGLLWSGYLKVNSPLFKKKEIFPPIRTFGKNGEIVDVKVKTDMLNYRINDLNKYRFHFFNNSKYAIERRDFWFKLNKRFFFYSINPDDVNILQTFPLQDMQTIEPIQKKVTILLKRTVYFFAIIEKRTRYRYQFESTLFPHIKTIFCLIKKQLHIDDAFCQDNPLKPDDNEPEPADLQIIKEEIDPQIILPKRTKFCNENWNYDNHGDDWECECKEGNQQSPINLPKIENAIDSPVTPFFQFDIIPALNKQATVEGYIKKNSYTKIVLKDNALRILHPKLGKITAMNGSNYVGEEITFHTPSEHTIDGKRFDMEMQVVFYGNTKGDIAKNVILSFLFEAKNGYYNRFLDDIDFYNLPSDTIKEKNLAANLFIPKVFYSVTGTNDVEEKLAVLQPFSFFTYEGSLTNPPCTEDTVHYIYSKPIPIARMTLNFAIEAIRRKDKVVEMWDYEVGKKTFEAEMIKVENYRNVQEKNNRRVFHYNADKYFKDYPSVKDPVQTDEFHYEKILQESTEYMFVPGQKPSGIPGSFLVDEKEAKGTDHNKNYN